MFGLFGNAAPAPAASSAPANQGNQGNPTGEGGQQQQSQGNQGNQGNQGGQGNQQQQQQQQQAKPEGLDYLSALFDNKQGGSQGNQAPRLQFTQEQLSGVANKRDFSSAISPEQMQKLQSGDISALGDILNNLGRQVYQQAIQDASHLTDQYVDARFNHDGASFDQRVARSTSTQNVSGISDLHPMAQNMLRGTIAQLREANPQAPQAELESQAWDLLHSLGGQFDRKGRQQQQQAQQAEPNWDEYGGFVQEPR